MGEVLQRNELSLKLRQENKFPITVTPGLGGDFLVAFVSVGQAAGQAVSDVDADLAGFTGIHLVALDVQQVHIVQGNRLAHGTQLVVVTVQV